MNHQAIKFKWLISEYDVRSTEITRYPLMSVSQYLGVVPRSELKGDEGRAESTENYKTSKPGQIVLNRMSAASGALGRLCSIATIKFCRAKISLLLNEI
jgi:hypothetical protein